MYVAMMSCVDGSPLKLQLRLQLLNKEESNGTDQDGWVGFREVSIAFSGKT
jgi:hypothetical protein